jgi:serine/threonine protein kinase
VMLDSTQERDKFLQEAQLLEKLKHPHILPIIDVGIHDDIPYIITEYAAQGSLQERLQLQQNRPLPLQEAQTIVLQIGQALHFAHQQQIIHRDLKPANILFNANGHAMLADFGIATLTESARTVSADAIGSPPYMAPEQFDGIVSMKSDQYALGCLAYELFTGSRPFQSPADPTWFAWRHKHLIEVPPAPTQFNSYLAPSIEQALLKALAKDRLRRHADIATFVMALATPTLSQEYSPTQPSQMPMVSDKPSTTDPEQYKQTSIVERPSPAEAEPSDKGEISQPKKNVQAEKRDKAKPVSGILRNERVMACLAYIFSFLGPIGWPIVLIFLLMDLKKRFVRFHAMQALWLVSLFSIIGFVLLDSTSILFDSYYNGYYDYYIYMQSIAVLDIIFALLYFILLLIGLRGALQGRNTKLPLIGKRAEKFANKVSR